MSAVDPMGLDQQLCFALYAATHAITRSYTPGLKSIGLTYPQYLVMVVLWQEDALTLKALAERLDLDSPTLTPLLKRLEAVGYLHRRRSEADERQVLIYLSDTGQALRQQAVSMRQQLQCRFAELLPQAEGLRDALQQLLRLLR